MNKYVFHIKALLGEDESERSGSEFDETSQDPNFEKQEEYIPDTDEYFMPHERKRSRGEGFDYNHERTFEKLEDAEDYIANENTWNKSRISITSDGHKRYFKCRFKYRCKCEATLYVLNDNNGTFKVYRSTKPHSEHTDFNRGLNQEIKDFINNLISQNTFKPKEIYNKIKLQFVNNLPDKSQVQNYIQQLRRKKILYDYNTSIPTTGEKRSMTVFEDSTNSKKHKLS